MAYANSADPDQTGSSLIRVCTVCQSTKYFKKQLHKKQKLGKKVWNEVFKILGHLRQFDLFYTFSKPSSNGMR